MFAKQKLCCWVYFYTSICLQNYWPKSTRLVVCAMKIDGLLPLYHDKKNHKGISI